VLYNNQGMAQPLVAGQSLQMTFEMQPGDDGVAELTLICRPGD